ncbi:PhoH family protein [Rubripirellula sp.]|nr:PhoH family protein [Rubripirellula sp.]MDB4338640.1 PhoH family protein [Rubripirellula sp.]
MKEATLSIANQQEILDLFGPRDQHLRRIRRLFDVNITQRDGSIRIAGGESGVQSATRTLEKLRQIARKNGGISPVDVDQAAFTEGASIDNPESTLQRQREIGANQSVGAPSRDSYSNASPNRSPSNADTEIHLQHGGRRVKPRTSGQARYVEAIRKYDLTFATGPAGCGKTYLAVATAVESLRAAEVRKIVLVRPAVEAGENLGFLPGDLRAKLNPYLRPLMDALGDMLDYDQARHLMEQDTIEVIPLAYMRGRTLNDAFIILDEAQNATIAQMKMFLTRMGERSKMVVSGDATQQDLPRGVTSGLRDALKRLSKIDGIGVVRLQASDIVRHRLVQSIVAAYEDNE